MRTAAATALLFLFAACGDNKTPAPRAAYEPATLAPLTCVPNLDGKIDANELDAAIGVPASYLVSPPGTKRTVDLVGQVDGSGVRVWDWSVDLADDRLAKIAASALDGKWYAASFPTGAFVAPFDAGGRLEAVYRHDANALTLLGVASKDEHPAEGKTLLVYDPAPEVYRFPIQPGQSYVSVGKVANGTLRDLPYAGRDTYEVKVDAAGRINLPDLGFTQAMRTRTKVTVEPAVGVPVVRRQTSFLFECFGEVARATSQDDEPNDDFTTAAEVRRLGIP